MSLNPKQHRLLVRVVDAITEATDTACQPPSPPELATKLHAPPQAIEAILTIGLNVGALVQVAPGRFLPPERLETIAGRLAQLDSPISPPALRETLAVNRPWGEALARALVERGLLRRVPGGYQILRPKPEAPPRRSAPAKP